MKKMLSFVLLAVCALVPQAAMAYTVDATLTADNHYGLYYGNADGSSLTLVGRNEKGTNGNGGSYNWSLPESYSFDTANDNYLYVLAWDDASIQSWIGEFTYSGYADGTILSDLTNWKYMVSTGANPGESGDLPLLSLVQNDIANATWSIPQAEAVQGNYAWGTIPGISSSARFIWHDTIDIYSGSDSHYAIYRTELPVVVTPEPASMVLFGIGGAAMAFSRRRIKA